MTKTVIWEGSRNDVRMMQMYFRPAPPAGRREAKPPTCPSRLNDEAAGDWLDEPPVK